MNSTMAPRSGRFSGQGQLSGDFRQYRRQPVEPAGDRVQNHVVLEVGGQKIGIISALATDTPETASPGDVIFQDEIDSLKADVAALEAQGVTKIIALTMWATSAIRRLPPPCRGSMR
jgi:hypothetical protein